MAARDLRTHLFLFDPVYPIKKGYVARLLLGQTHTDVFQEVKAVVQTAEPQKTLNEENLSANLHRFKEILEDRLSTCEWLALIRFFIEPFPIAFSNFPILLDHVQPVLRSESATLKSTKVKLGRACLPPTVQAEILDISFTLPDVTSTPVKSFTAASCSRLLSPGKHHRECEKCAEKLYANLIVSEENSRLRTQLEELNQPIYEREERSRNALKRLHEIMKKRARAACVWKGKYAALKKTMKTAQRKWKMLHMLEQKARSLEDELCQARREISRLNEIIKQLNSKVQN